MTAEQAENIAYGSGVWGVLLGDVHGLLYPGMNPGLSEMPSQATFPCYDVHQALNFDCQCGVGLRGQRA